jgi:uncharacterized protein
MTATTIDRRIFVDTGAYFGATDRRDENHDLAASTMQELFKARRQFVTTNFVLAETHALILTRINRHVAADALVELRASQIIVRVRPRDERRAEEIIAQYDDKNFTFTDATSFAVMERLGLTQVFTFDHHFAQFGWRVLPLDQTRT